MEILFIIAMITTIWLSEPDQPAKVFTVPAVVAWQEESGKVFIVGVRIEDKTITISAPPDKQKSLGWGGGYDVSTMRYDPNNR